MRAGAPEKVEKDALVFVGVARERSTPASFQNFEAAVRKLPFILDCHVTAGEFDYFLKIIVRDIKLFNRLHREKLLKLPAVRQLRPFFVLKEVVDNAALDS